MRWPTIAATRIRSRAGVLYRFVTRVAGGMALLDQRKAMVGPLIVAALGILVWWLPYFRTFIFFPPLVLGFAVGLVARYTDAPPSVLVVTAAASTAIIFGVFAARVSSF